MTLDTVQDYVAAARTLLQDAVEPYRYDDSNFVDALNFALLQARLLRSDLFMGRAPDSFAANDDTAVTMDVQYRMALVYFVAGHVQLQDEEDTQDSRAAAFLQKFTALLVGGTS